MAGLAALILAGCSAGPATSAAIAIHFSRFGPDAVTVPAGVPVTFTLRNDDPIEHEWIVGPPEVHERHRLGTEPYHDQVPTEVTIPALSSRQTTVIFAEPGEYAFICHLQGHEAYGMRGMVRVVPR
jgi:uncharacterized cupredoxin-like copper-binding protein